jgi:hypothetical protein
MMKKKQAGWWDWFLVIQDTIMFLMFQAFVVYWVLSTGFTPWTFFSKA